MTLGIAIVGCGSVAPRYAARLRTMPGAFLIGAADIEIDRARDLVRSFGGRFYRDITGLLGDNAVDVVVNLTPPSLHADITDQALRNRCHVYSEKPLALDPNDATRLVQFAECHGLQLGCAPATVLSPAQRDAVEIVLSGRLGHVRIAYAEADWGRADLSSTPGPLIDVGPMVDVGIYPLALLVAALGRVVSVSAFGAATLPERTSADFIVATMKHQSGALSRLTSSFYVQHRPGSSSVTFHGDEGSAFLASWHDDHAEIRLASRGQPYAIERAATPTKPPVDWGRGVEDLLGAIRDERAPLTGGAGAVHLVEVLSAVKASMTSAGTEQLIDGSLTSPT